MHTPLSWVAFVTPLCKFIFVQANGSSVPYLVFGVEMCMSFIAPFVSACESHD